MLLFRLKIVVLFLPGREQLSIAERCAAIRNTLISRNFTLALFAPSPLWRKLVPKFVNTSTGKQRNLLYSMQARKSQTADAVRRHAIDADATTENHTRQELRQLRLARDTCYLLCFHGPLSPSGEWGGNNGSAVFGRHPRPGSVSVHAHPCFISRCHVRVFRQQQSASRDSIAPSIKPIIRHHTPRGALW